MKQYQQANFCNALADLFENVTYFTHDTEYKDKQKQSNTPDEFVFDFKSDDESDDSIHISHHSPESRYRTLAKPIFRRAEEPELIRNLNKVRPIFFKLEESESIRNLNEVKIPVVLPCFIKKLLCSSNHPDQSPHALKLQSTSSSAGLNDSESSRNISAKCDNAEKDNTTPLYDHHRFSFTNENMFDSV
mmetsp:Transcript_7543/g.15651  ORF Transcript_7543/g.15651 Transcript_7543/m.15651 type:complete len:189 (+) Transcript_7543:235-801(+)